jgi:phosphoserine/homoserine phosphotransferase
MEFACLDLEGVLIPEVWIGVAERTGIETLRATTRDIPDYDRLMRQRLEILDEHGLGMADIQAVIGGMAPLEGAREFLGWLRAHFQVVILSDTFYEFAAPLMRQLDWPTLMCHRLEVAGNGRVTGYRLCVPGHKREAVRLFKSFNFPVFAAGDSYNDTAMLSEADVGILFRAPANVIAEFPRFQTAETFDELKAAFVEASPRF